MTLSSALDGNAIAGQLVDIFGAEMTTMAGTCATCGTSGMVAELAVYVRAPGTIARCRSCESVVMVLVTIRGITCVDLRGFAELESPVTGAATVEPDAAK
jgi:Family of unknown function (DUF6510)